MHKITRIPGCVGAATFTAASVYPLRFVHGLLFRSIEAGLQLFTHTPVTSIENQQQKQEQGIWTLSTPRGTLRAKHVLLATNGYTEALVPGLGDFLLSHKAQCSSIDPPPAYRDEGSLKQTYSIAKGGEDFEYLVQRPHNDAERSSKGGPFILGGGHPLTPRDQVVGTVDDSTVSDAVTEHLRTYPGRTFEGWNDNESRLTHVWTGIQGCESTSRNTSSEADLASHFFLSQKTPETRFRYVGSKRGATRPGSGSASACKATAWPGPRRVDAA